MTCFKRYNDIKHWPRVQKYIVIPFGVCVLPFVICGRFVWHKVLKTFWQKVLKRAYFAFERFWVRVYDKLVEWNDKIDAPKVVPQPGEGPTERQ